MALTPNVVANAPILSTWGNEIRDRTVQVFASAAERSAQWTAPPEGAVSYLRDTDALYVYNGTAWIWTAGGAQPTYAARMHRVAAHSSGVGTIRIPYDTVTYDYNANLTVGASAQYTVPVTGLYDLRANCVIAAANNPQSVYLAIFKVAGGVLLAQGGTAVIRNALGTDNWSFSINDTLAFTAGDQIHTAFANGGGNAVNFVGGSAYNFFAVRRV